jgi:hypothetical protein
MATAVPIPGRNSPRYHTVMEVVPVVEVGERHVVS